MPISGLGSAFAFAAESVYNTPVATTTKLPIESEGLATANGLVDPAAMWPGQLVTPDENLRPGLITHSGPVPLFAYNLGQEELWRAAFGGYSFATGTHTFTPAIYDESLTLAFGIGGDTGVPMKTYSGAIATGWVFDVQAEQAAKFTPTFVAKSIATVDSGTVAGATPAGLVTLNWSDVTALTIGGAAFDCARGITITGSPSYTLGRTCLGSLEINDPRVASGMFDFTATIKVDFEDFVASTPNVIADFLAGATAEPFVLTMVNGPSTYAFTGQAKVTGGNPIPNIGGPEIVEIDVPIKFVSDIGDDSAALSLALTNGTTTL